MTTEPEKPKGKRWVKILLVVSLGLNLTIVSFVIGIAIKGAPGRPTSQNPDAIAFLSYALPKQHRQEIRQELIDRRESLRANREALRGLRAEMIELLQEEPFEIEKVRQILERQRSHFLSLGELAHDALIRRIAMLTPEERAIYVESLRRDEGPPRPRN